MSREVDDFFDEIETKIPEDVSRLVEKQMDIAEAIADAIDRNDFKNRKEFAQTIGMKPSMLSRILAGNANLTLKTITKIEAALETDIISITRSEAKAKVIYAMPMIDMKQTSVFISSEPTIQYTGSIIADTEIMSSEFTNAGIMENGARA